MDKKKKMYELARKSMAPRLKRRRHSLLSIRSFDVGLYINPRSWLIRSVSSYYKNQIGDIDGRGVVHHVYCDNVFEHLNVTVVA